MADRMTAATRHGRARSIGDAVQANLPLQVQPGVHLNMPERVYFSARAIGSSDLRILYWDPSSWHAASEFNPNRRAPANPTRSPGKELGSALHALILEGEEAYTTRFTIEPDDGSSRYAKTRDELRRVLKEANVELPRGEFDQGRLNSLVRRAGLAHKVFATARADYEAARRAGRHSLTEDEDRRLRSVAHLIGQHNQLGSAFRGGLSEVSVFWRRDDDPDTLLRARFDKLRVKRIYDLKTLANWKGRDIDAAIREAIEYNDYDIQRRLYMEAWARMAEFVREGEVHAWSPDGAAATVIDEDRGYLNQIVDAGEPQWVWVFVQLPVDEIGRERGTVIAARYHQASGRLWDQAGVKIETALSNLRTYRKRFGLDRPWALIDDEVRELTDGDVRSFVKKEIG